MDFIGSLTGSGAEPAKAPESAPAPPSAGPPARAGAAPSEASADAKDEAEEIKKHPFFHYYGQLVHQQNMLQDQVRTGTYQRAIFDNPSNFKDKVVLDVGTGSGILAMFAAQAGARRVYAVEASDMALCAEKLVQANNLGHIIKVIKGKLENIELEEKVDIVISEPMGFLLVHERMLESYVLGRIRFMKPSAPPKMFPSTGTMFFLPFSDWSLYNELYAKAHFWSSKDFYGVDFSSLQEEALRQHFGQPVVGAFDPSIIISDYAKPATHTINFESTSVEEMHTISIDFEYVINTTTLCHGLACWFDVDFIGNHRTVTLSTAPTEPTTHWYQARLLLPKPIAVNEGQSVSGTIKMTANEHFSYTIELSMWLCGTDIVVSNTIQLHDQMYHYLQTSQPGFQE